MRDDAFVNVPVPSVLQVPELTEPLTLPINETLLLLAQTVWSTPALATANWLIVNIIESMLFWQALIGSKFVIVNLTDPKILSAKLGI